MYSVIAAVASAFFAGIAAYQTYKGHKRNSIENGAARLQIRAMEIKETITIKSGGKEVYAKTYMTVDINNIGNVISPKGFVLISDHSDENNVKEYLSKPLVDLRNSKKVEFMLQGRPKYSKMYISLVTQDLFGNLFITYDGNLTSQEHLYNFYKPSQMISYKSNSSEYKKIITHMKNAKENSRHLGGINKNELTIFKDIFKLKADKKAVRKSLGKNDIKEVTRRDECLVDKAYKLCEIVGIDIEMDSIEVL